MTDQLAAFFATLITVLLVPATASASVIDYQPLTNGQLQIGYTGQDAAAATLSQGTTQGVTIANGAGSITLDTAQDIRATASPTFAGLSLSPFTLGSIHFTGASGLTSQNNSKFFWDNTNYRLGIGSAAPDSAITISNNVSALPAPISGTYNLLHLGSLDGVPNTILSDSFGGQTQHIMRRADGTAASPSAVQNNDALGQYLFLGYGATSYQSNAAAKIAAMAAENWTDSTGAAVLQFFTRPSGTTAAGTERVRIDQNGNVGIGATGPLSPLQVGAPTGSYDTPIVAGFFSGSDSSEDVIIARNVTQPQEMQLGVNQAGLYSEIQATHAQVAYDYLVLNRQGGNVGIANAAPSYTLDVSGTFRATTSVTDGGLAGAPAGAPVSVNSTGTLVSGITNAEVNSSSSLAIGTGTTVIGGATTTPAAGTYLVTASANITAASAGGNKLTIELFVGGTGAADTIRTAIPLSSAALAVFQNMSISFNKIVAVNGSQALALEGGSSAGTVTITGLDFDVVRLQ